MQLLRCKVSMYSSKIKLYLIKYWKLYWLCACFDKHYIYNQLPQIGPKFDLPPISFRICKLKLIIATSLIQNWFADVSFLCDNSAGNQFQFCFIRMTGNVFLVSKFDLTLKSNINRCNLRKSTKADCSVKYYRAINRNLLMLYFVVEMGAYVIFHFCRTFVPFVTMVNVDT